MVVYRITRGGEDGTVLTGEVVVEDGQYRCRQDSQPLPGCQGHETLKLALAAHEELTQTGESKDVRIECSELPDYRLVTLLPKGVANVTINGFDWYPEEDEDRIKVTIWGGVEQHPSCEPEWLTLHCDAEPGRARRSPGGFEEEYLHRLGDFYGASCPFGYPDDESEPEDFYCEDPTEAIRFFLGLSGFHGHDESRRLRGNLVSWIEADILRGDDNAVMNVLGQYIRVARKRAFVVWVNGELWEWPMGEEGIRRRRPNPDAREKAPWCPGMDKLPEQVLIGRDEKSQWLSLRILEAGEIDSLDTQNDSLPSEYRGSWVAALPPIPASQAVDPLLYEQLIEAAFKYPGAGFGDSQPPYAILRFAEGLVSCGVVVKTQREAELLATAFGFPFPYLLWSDSQLDAPDALAVKSGAWSAKAAVKAATVDVPEDRSFMVHMISSWDAGYPA